MMGEMTRQRIHFEIPAENPRRVLRFYQELFGWRAAPIEAGAESWILPADESSMPFQNAIRVASLDECLANVERLGGAIARAKKAISGRGYVAYCRDPEGNVFVVFELDSKV